MEDRIKVVRRELTRVDGNFPLHKHQKMSLSPFVFMRGSAQLFYHDLKHKLVDIDPRLYQIPKTCVMGDCHLTNFGFFTEEGSHGDSVIFAPNDFDDACIGHAVWDLLRFTCSITLARAHCEGLFSGEPHIEADGGENTLIPLADVNKAIIDFIDTYLQTCQKSMDRENYLLAGPDYHWRSKLMKKAYKKAQKRSADGRDFDIKSSLAKAVDMGLRPLRFRERPGHFKRLSEEKALYVMDSIAPYVDDTILDIVERVNAGTGSVNMKRYYLLVGPENISEKNQNALCHIVEVKCQREAAALSYFPELSSVNKLNPAHLTVNCQRKMMRRPDLVLDEVAWQGAHWLVRSRHHARVGLNPEDIGMGEHALAGGFSEYVNACAHSLALAHCRGDRRSVLFERAVCEHLHTAKASLIESAQQYSELVKRDYQLLHELLKSA